MGRHDALIEKIFKSEEDRALARAFVGLFADVPGMADRIAPLLHEAARSAEQVGGGVMSPEDARAYLASFAQEGLGAPPHLVQEIQNWQPDPSLLAPDTEQPPQPAPESAQPAKAQLPAAPTQEQAAAAPADTTARMAEIEAMMKAPYGSDAWRSYWAGESGAKVQQEYRDLLALKAAGADAPSLLPSLAAPAQPAAASGPTPA